MALGKDPGEARTVAVAAAPAGMRVWPVAAVASANPAPVGPPKRARDAVLTALEATPEDLARLIKDRSHDDLLQPSSDGGWGVVEILAHLRDWEEIFLDRVQRTAADEDPFLPVVDDELWPIERDYRGQDPTATLNQFRDLRGQLVKVLRSLPAEAWDRRAIHGAFGEVSLLWLADHICEHDREYIDRARDALA